MVPFPYTCYVIVLHVIVRFLSHWHRSIDDVLVYLIFHVFHVFMQVFSWRPFVITEESHHSIKYYIHTRGTTSVRRRWKIPWNILCRYNWPWMDPLGNDNLQHWGKEILTFKYFNYIGKWCIDVAFCSRSSPYILGKQYLSTLIENFW